LHLEEEPDDGDELTVPSKATLQDLALIPMDGTGKPTKKERKRRAEKHWLSGRETNLEPRLRLLHAFSCSFY